MEVSRRRVSFSQRAAGLSMCCLTLAIVGAGLSQLQADQPPTESDFYRIVSISTSQASSDSRSATWRPAPTGLALEVSGIAPIDDNRIAVCIRKGEVWILGGVYENPPANITYHQFASALHEPLGIIYHNESFYTAQRTELTRLQDTNGDQVADQYLTVAKGWGLTGQYHEYAYGPKLDKNGNLWITLNIGLGLKGDELKYTIHDSKLNFRQAPWRGWGIKITPDGKMLPQCAGMRSPSGLGPNAEGDMFYTDQQGNWVGTNSLHHMREGVFFHHPESLVSANLPGSPIRGVSKIPSGIPFPEALKSFPLMKPPAVWFPYKKMGQSTTDIMLDSSQGKFGPFAGQLFVGEFTQASMNRVFLEKIDGEYQGACFPFRRGFASAVLRMAQGSDGSVFAGLTNRGWSSLGTASYGLQRLVWTEAMPFEIKEMKATQSGFELVFTQPVDSQSAANPSSYTMESYTYLYKPDYGSDEIQKQALAIDRADVSQDGLSVKLTVKPLRPFFVHELNALGVRNTAGQPLLHSQAYYTLNRIPK